ncbi:MAG: hypothetical protein K6T85_09645 [Gorillibacterium sp.]|nr:hypothetical protein [Gorillibacterium sp.]
MCFLSKFKIVTLAVAVGACAVLVLFLWYIYSKPYTLQVQGIQCQLGETHQDYVEPVTITINGTVQKRLNGSQIFKGMIEIEGEGLPHLEDQKKVLINIDKRGRGTIFDYYFDQDAPGPFSYDSIFIDDKFESLTILVKKEVKAGAYSWTSDDGIIIAAPAINREEAVALSEKLMR